MPPYKTGKPAQQAAKQRGQSKGWQAKEGKLASDDGQAGRATPAGQARVAGKQSRGGYAGSLAPTPESQPGWQSPVDFFSDNEASPFVPPLPVRPRQAKAAQPVFKMPRQWQPSTPNTPNRSLERGKPEESDTSLSDADMSVSGASAKTTAARGALAKRGARSRSTPGSTEWTPLGLKLQVPGSFPRERGLVPLDFSFGSPRQKTSTPLQRHNSALPIYSDSE